MLDEETPSSIKPIVVESSPATAGDVAPAVTLSCTVSSIVFPFPDQATCAIPSISKSIVAEPTEQSASL